MKERKTSRVLNDESYFLGLSYGDITGTGVFLLVLLLTGKAMGIQSMLWALVLSVTVLLLLIPIRLKFRRKIIRDSIKYLFSQGVYVATKNNRNK